MVASVIFLTAFLAGMETITKVSAPTQGTLQYIETENQYRMCLNECRNGIYSYGDFTKKYDWGTITISIEPYEYCDAVFLARIGVKTGVNNYEYFHIIEK
jgi:hypothetical protein